MATLRNQQGQLRNLSARRAEKAHATRLLDRANLLGEINAYRALHGKPALTEADLLRTVPKTNLLGDHPPRVHYSMRNSQEALALKFAALREKNKPHA